MFYLSIFAFFIVIFLLATITVAIAWMTFLKRQAERAEAAGEVAGEPAPALDEDSPLFRSQRLSTLTFWDGLLTRFDFVRAPSKWLASPRPLLRADLCLRVVGFPMPATPERLRPFPSSMRIPPFSWRRQCAQW
jgi:hypothetical protein